MSRILVVDDKELMRDSVATMLTRAGWTVQSVCNGKDAIRAISDRRPEAVLTDLQMPEMNGLELLREIRKVDEELPVVFMTAFGTVETAVEAMKLGAYDYITKPFNGDQLVATMKRAIEHARLVRENAILQSQVDEGDGSTRSSGSRRARRTSRPILVGDSAIMRSLKSQISRIAPSQSTVLICGESGVGKEVVAQTVHRLSTRSGQPMLAVNCAALSASLLESELFGHERGAFTGADRMRKGRFELADGGTLLLDEISEVPTHIQAKLLRVLQERTFERVGSSVSLRTDVRVIATTNRDLAQEVEAGRFRQDLFYRLNVLPLVVPRLCDRVEDIPELANHFLKIVAMQEGRAQRRFDDQAIHLLQTYNWPGNVRELANLCERASLFSEDDVIRAEVIRPWLVGSGVAPVAASRTPERPRDTVIEPRMASFSTGAPGAGNAAATEPDLPRLAHLPGCSVEAERAFSRQDPAMPASSYREPALATENGALAEAHLPPQQIVRINPGKSLEEVEREVIVATLKRHDGHRQKTANALGIAVRTLGLKLRKWKELQLVEEDL